jgi:hypothetical protein
MGGQADVRPAGNEAFPAGFILASSSSPAIYNESQTGTNGVA